jgi:methyl-accepting chemotaxis protein WspA
MADPAGGGAQPHRNRRRFSSHLVNGDVRLRLVGDDVVFAMVAALAAIGILYVLSNREIGDNLWSAHVSIKETRELLTTGVKVAGVVTFVAVSLFGIWSLIDAHRIAGPMHRLNRLLNEIADGDLTHEIQFRRRDEFKEIARAADRLVDEYAARIAALQVEAMAIEEGLAADSLPPVRLRELREHAASLRESLGYFRLPEDGVEQVDGSALH